MDQKRRRRKRGEEQERARQRALVILKVRSGVFTATQGAQALGVSRKTYYEWEEKSLQAMALENQPAGRPPAPVDEEKEALRQRVRELEEKLDRAEKTIKAKELRGPREELRRKGSKKNRSIGKKR
jgi:hypothetical protein